MASALGDRVRKALLTEEQAVVLPSSRTEVEPLSDLGVAAEVPPTEPASNTDWQDLYAQLTLGQVVDETRALHSAIEELANPYFQQCWDRGDYEVVGVRNPEEPYKFPSQTFDDLCHIALFEDGTVARVVLPREQYPEAYELREKVMWLQIRQEELEALPSASLPVIPRR